MEFLNDPAMSVFYGALIALGVIALIEVVSFFIVGAAALSSAVELAEIDTDVSGYASWLVVKGMPLMVTVVVALSGFTVGGFLLQFASHALRGEYFGQLASVLGAVVVAILSIRAAGAFFAKHKVDFSSTAVSQSSLIGREARIVSAEVYQGYPGEAQVEDAHGKTHYIQVEPQEAEQRFKSGDTVTLTEFREPVFLVLPS